MSIPRPDPASPAQVADATFSTGRRGFDQGEVRDFLRMVAAELTRLRERELFLEREVQAARETVDLSTAQFDDETLTRMLGEETVRILNAARESSNEIRSKAEHAAAQMLVEASDESTRLREEAEIEAARRRSDAANDAEAELSMAKQQGREMVNEARAYRERVLSELARRRELAREQIEQLVHGRDRLMQAFERARLVAVDVVAEVQPLGEPDEYVNLQPSTGPVPVMVARDATAPTSDVDGEVDTDTDTDSDAAAEVAAFDTDTDSDAAGEVGIYDRATDEPSDDDRSIDVPTQSADDDVDASTDDASGAVDGAIALVHTKTDERTDGDTGTDDSATSDDETDDETDDATDSDIQTATEEVPSTGPDLDAGSVDDVVVDLFARLRATSDDDPIDDADAEASEPDIADEPIDATSADGSMPSDVPVGDGDASADAGTEDEIDDEDEIEDVTPFQQRDADLTPLIVTSARKLKRVLADEQNEVLDTLRRSDPVRNLDALLPWANHHAERYSRVISEELLAAANAGATMTVGKTSAKLRKAAGKQATQQASETITRSLVTLLRDRLERCVVDGDGDNPAITKKVRAVYREFKTQHIDEQLDDVFRAAHGRGVLASFELDTPVMWMPDPSHDVCPDCDDNRLQGAVAAGQAFPTGHVCTPAHPGCRCLLVLAAR